MDRVDLPFERASAALARRLVGEAAVSFGAAGDPLDDVMIVVHELVTNALDHGAPSVTNTLTLTWHVEDLLLCIGVRDHGCAGTVEVQPLDLASGRGRGLALVSAVSARWLVERDVDTLVTAWVRLSHGGDPR